jgi:hypothetical protein
VDSKGNDRRPTVAVPTDYKRKPITKISGESNPLVDLGKV